MTSLACWRDKGQLFYCVIFQRGCAVKKSTVTCCTLDWCMELPSEKISQSRTPYDHTSLWVVKTLSKIDSGAIHFSGNRALWQNTFITHIWPFTLCCWPLTLIYRWQYTHISLAHIVWVFVYVSSQAKVTDLHHIVVGQQDVSGSKVTMNALKTWKDLCDSTTVIFILTCPHVNRKEETLPCERRETPCLWPPESCKKSGLQAAEGWWIQEEKLGKTNNIAILYSTLVEQGCFKCAL